MSDLYGIEVQIAVAGKVVLMVLLIGLLPTDPPPPLRSAMKPHPDGRRHTDGMLEEKRHVQFLTQPPKVGESLRPFRLRGPSAALESSLLMSKSLFNPNMSVTQSGLGTSVRLGQVKAYKKGQRGHRILCLDGGGIKVCSQCSARERERHYQGCTNSRFAIYVCVYMDVREA